ncbi:MAG: hypothetical protein ACYS6K_16955, partial [Planctomycetota bacterium]
GNGLVSGDAIVFEDNVDADGTGAAEDQRFDAKAGSLVTDNTIDIDKSTDGSLTLGGDDGIELGGNVTGSGLSATGSIIFEDDVTANGTSSPFDQRLDAGAGTLQADDTITKTTEGDLYIGGAAGVDLDGTVEVQIGSLTIEDHFSAEADLLASENVTFEGSIVNGEFDGIGDQKVDAQNGMITANGWLWKNSDWGSLYLEAADDISLADDVEVTWGGVSIISETGKIFTPDEFGGETDTLNVGVYGWSDDYMGDGVDLLYGPGKAAIIIASAENLNLGPDAELVAEGVYDDTGAVDDRAGVGFVDAPDTYIPLPPGDLLRDEGDPFDAAIYLASTDGDVDVSSPVSIMSGGVDDGPPPVPQGAMIVDAWDTVTFGSLFEDSLANGDVGDRLEVVSRISEWLYQAVGRLPYVYGGGIFPPDYAYVLRGAGLGNPDITDGRAWVLEDPLNAAPLYQEAGQASDEQEIGLDGCPVLVAAASAELGIPGDTIEVSLANSYALNTDIQPCETCARLVNAAAILADADGSAMAAMNQVFNELAPAGAPYTPEMATSIVTAFAGRVNDGTQYATAIEYIDAFVNYIAVLDSEMGTPVGDSVAFTMQKYGSGITGSDNANMAAFVAARLEAGETFGQ